MLKKLKLGSSLIALILFAFPWVDIQCSQKSLATQSGFQVIYGGGTPSEEMEAMGDDDSSGDSGDDAEKESVGFSPLVGLALLCVIGGLISAIIAIFRGGERADLMASVLPTVALVLIGGSTPDWISSKERNDGGDVRRLRKDPNC